MDQIAALLQALQQRQIPPLTAPAPQPVAAPPVAPPAAPPPVVALPVAPAAVPQPVAAPPVAPAAAPPPDALSWLRLILTNPQLQQALQPAVADASAAVSRTVQLPVPTPAAPQQLRSAQIPLATVFNAIAALAGRVTAELGEDMGEDESAYLVGDDGYYLVDPASADDRAALAAHLFRLNDAAQRSGWYPQLDSWSNAAGFELDECDEWARAAGFP
jgi:hypothetical protein